MTDETQKRVLLKMLNALDKPEQERAPSKFPLIFLWFIACFVIAALLQLDERGEIEPIIIIFASSIMGCVYGWVAQLQVSRARWHILKPHIDVDSIKQRLKDLEG